MADRTDRYAMAIFELATAEGVLTEVERQLFDMARVFESSSELRTALTDPMIPLERKAGIINDLVGERVTEVTLGIIEYLLRQGRIVELPGIAERLGKRTSDISGTLIAEVRTAIDLDKQTVKKLEAAFEKIADRPVEVRVVIDETVLGGILARVGDTVIDGSVARRLESLRSAATGRG